MPDEKSLLDRIERAMIEAMKSRNAGRTSTLRMVKSALKYREIDKRAPLDDGDVLQVLATMAKQRRESIEQFRAGGREDLVEKESAELRILQEFLPEEMGDDELRRLVAAAVAEVGARGAKDLGRVMAVLMPRVKGRADGKTVNSLVRDVLSAGGET